MMLIPHRGAITIFLSFLLALVLTVIPLPDWGQHIRPQWVTLVLIYWCLALPQRVGIFSGWLAGLGLDVLTGTVLGQHAMALLLVGYMTQKFSLQIRVFPLSQMTLTVFALLGAYQFLLFWIDGMAGRQVPMMSRWLPVITGGLLWPLIMGFLDNLRQEAQSRI